MVIPLQITANGGEEYLPNNIRYSLATSDYSSLFAVDNTTAEVTYLADDLTPLPPCGLITLLIEATELRNPARTSVAPLYLTYEDGGDPPIVIPILQQIQLPYGYSRTEPCAAITTSSQLDTSYNAIKWDPLEFDERYFALQDDGTFICYQLSDVINEQLPLEVTYVVEAVNEDGTDRATVVFFLEEEFLDPPPEFSDDIYDDKELSSNYTTDTDCYSVAADSEGDSTVRYSVTNISPEEYSSTFVLDPISGVFTCVELGHPTWKSERVTVAVTATNEGGSDSTSVVFSLLGAEGVPPSFPEKINQTDLEVGYPVAYPCYNVSIESPADSAVYVVEEVYPDEYTNIFAVDNSTGVITCEEILWEVEDPVSVTMLIKATNYFGSDNTVVIFDVLPLPQRKPVFKQSIYEAEQEIRSDMDILQCDVVNAGTFNLNISYSVEDVHPKDYKDHFVIDDFSGVVDCLFAGTDFNDLTLTDAVTLTVKATNENGTDVAAMVFNLQSVNDVDSGITEVIAPAFEESIYLAGYIGGQPCFRMSTDGDSYWPTRYNISDVSPSDYSGYFTIDSTTGVITCKSLSGAQMDTKETVTVLVEATNFAGFDKSAIVFRLLDDYEFESDTVCGITTEATTEDDDLILLLIFGGVGAFVCLAALILLAFIALRGAQAKKKLEEEEEEEIKSLVPADVKVTNDNVDTPDHQRGSSDTDDDYQLFANKLQGLTESSHKNDGYQKTEGGTTWVMPNSVTVNKTEAGVHFQHNRESVKSADV